MALRMASSFPFEILAGNNLLTSFANWGKNCATLITFNAETFFRVFKRSLKSFSIVATISSSEFLYP